VEPVCPAARLIDHESGPAVICGVKERDAARADSILEGVGTGIVVTARLDPSSFFGFCCGDGAPGHPDQDPPPRHYTGCPVWAAGREVDVAERIWKFEAPDDPREVERRMAEELGLDWRQDQVPTNEELAALFDFEA
jgi:hypothetical protein